MLSLSELLLLQNKKPAQIQFQLRLQMHFLHLKESASLRFIEDMAQGDHKFNVVIIGVYTEILEVGMFYLLYACNCQDHDLHCTRCVFTLEIFL